MVVTWLEKVWKFTRNINFNVEFELSSLCPLPISGTAQMSVKNFYHGHKRNGEGVDLKDSLTASDKNRFPRRRCSALN